MVSTIFAFKKGMSLRFAPDARRMPVTELWVKPNVVVGQKLSDKDGYGAWQIGIGSSKNASKPKKGQYKNLEATPRFVREVKSTEEDNLEIGDQVGLDILKPGDLVKVSGISKGKGFAGGVKRWGFAGGPKTHGQSDRHRAPGSIGQGTTPGRVLKGKKMAGHLGAAGQTVKNLTVWEVDPAQGLLVLSGSVPGYRGTLLKVTKIGENKKFVLPEVSQTQEDGQEEDEAATTNQNPETKPEITYDQTDNLTESNKDEKEGDKNATSEN